MNERHSTKKLILCCVAAALAAACITIISTYLLIGGKDGLGFFKKINTVRSIVASEYVGEIDWDKVADGASKGMIEAIGDRWSYYMTSSEYASYRDYSSNSTNGIGITIEKNDGAGGFSVLSVTAGSPAEAAGISVGQIIVSVAGQDVSELDAAGLKELVQSQTVEYEISLKNIYGTLSVVTIHNEVIYTNPVSYKMLEDGAGYIRIINFEQGAASEGIDAIESLLADGAKSIIFDVRSNPGGRLSELVDLLDYILPEGDIFVSVDIDGEETIYTSDESCIKCPMAVLINGDSYSAAEFFAAALSEYGYAVTVGEPSTGKARSQVTFELTDGSAVHISTRNYLTPNRVNLADQGGLVPDIFVEAGVENDTQLDRAVKYLS